ncbi:hypothetical protein [uncultured Hymenobacter sp.]|uniref:hypothetical protein n=1 Tax=uncultured Hymenobacter sp. TaxID=170016 RepID=UPI0035CC5103
MVPFPTPPWQPIRLLLLLLLTGAGCQSARTAFEFQPPTSVPPAASVPAGAAPRSAHSQPDGSVLSSPALARLAPRPAGRPQFQLRRRVAALVAQPVSSLRHNQKHKQLTASLRPRPTRHHANPAPAAVAENGLGTTFIGILGIVLLAVGLVGLLLAGWGVFGWLAVAGAVGLLISILAPYFGW